MKYVEISGCVLRKFMETWNLEINKISFFGKNFFSLDEEGSSNWRHIGEPMEVPRDPGSQDRTFLEVWLSQMSL